MKRDFGVPPFPADLPATAPVPPYDGDDPAAALAELGVEVPALSVVDKTASGAPVWTMSIEPGYHGPGLWEEIRAAYPRTGLWPLFTTEDTWDRTGSEFGYDTPAVEVSGADWLRREYASRQDDPDSIPRGGPDWADLDLDDYDYEGFDWSDTWAIRPDCEEFDQLALIPVANSWLVPRELRWSGAVNCDVDGNVHAAVLRRWSAARGCELVALDLDTMWLKVDEPVLSEDAALAMALEAYLYCPDAATQDRDSVDELAESLLRPLWRLWWD
ncbi:DUF4253 domain-containing protein [Nocardia amamiensis]|uniref:DUF4253 domain-containing protein n=1 Tax=Nocardia TaxID=1817 RepID=UPI00340B4062